MSIELYTTCQSNYERPFMHAVCHRAPAHTSTAKNLKKGISASELKSLEKKLSQALDEIHRVMEPEARP